MATVSIVMGSKSDLPVMQEASKVLDSFGIDNSLSIMSAHRTPERAADFSKNAVNNGVKVIIAGAGGAAHLAGVMASLTTLPVIGVPIVSSNSIDGWDSLLSTVQMPSGIPVGTLAIGKAGAINAALLAVSILSVRYKKILYKLKKYRSNFEKKVPKRPY